jgi:hypothetical protein
MAEGGADDEFDEVHIVKLLHDELMASVSYAYGPLTPSFGDFGATSFPEHSKVDGNCRKDDNIEEIDRDLLGNQISNLSADNCRKDDNIEEIDMDLLGNQILNLSADTLRGVLRNLAVNSQCQVRSAVRREMELVMPTKSPVCDVPPNNTTSGMMQCDPLPITTVWACNVCTFQNEGDIVACVVCTTPRPAGQGASMPVQEDSTKVDPSLSIPNLKRRQPICTLGEDFKFNQVLFILRLLVDIFFVKNVH